MVPSLEEVCRVAQEVVPRYKAEAVRVVTELGLCQLLPVVEDWFRVRDVAEDVHLLISQAEEYGSSPDELDVRLMESEVFRQASKTIEDDDRLETAVRELGELLARMYAEIAEKLGYRTDVSGPKLHIYAY